MVFSAREGVEAQSETVWRQADKYKVPRLASSTSATGKGPNTLARSRNSANAGAAIAADPDSRRLGPSHAPNPFRAVIDLVEMKYLTFTGREVWRRNACRRDPEEHLPEAELYREQLLHELFNYSQELAELVLNEETPPVEVIRAPSARQSSRGRSCQ